MVRKSEFWRYLMIPNKYADFAWEQAETLLNIDSPTGFTAEAAAEYLCSLMGGGANA